MLSAIVKKEILDHLKSAKFLVSLAIVMVLMALSMAATVADYQRRCTDVVSAEKDLKSDVVESVVFRAPQTLSTLVQGKDGVVGNMARVSYMRLPSRLSGFMGEGESLHSQYVAGFTAVDLAFVVRVILSLVVLFLAYDAVSEEKASGTLRLMMANPVPRDKILLGKLLGGLIVVGVALVAAFAVSLLLLLTNPAIVLTGPDWIRIAGILGFSALYLVFFYALGLCASVVINRPSTTLMVLLQVWIFLVVLYPNLSMIAAASLGRLPTPAELDGAKKAAFEPYQAEYDAVFRRFQEAAASGTRDPQAGLRWKELWILQRELEHKVDQDLAQRQSRQMHAASWSSILSPAALYDRAVTRLARTDLVEYERFMDSVFRFWRALADRTLVIARNPGLKPKPPAPVFGYTPAPIADAFVNVLPEALVMAVLSLLCFVLAYVAFLRKDVR